MTKYIAHITPLNADKIGTKAHGTATFEENGDNLHIHVEMFDTPANIEHWEHFHGFADGKKLMYQLQLKTLTMMVSSTYQKPNQSPAQRWCR